MESRAAVLDGVVHDADVVRIAAFIMMSHESALLDVDQEVLIDVYPVRRVGRRPGQLIGSNSHPAVVAIVVTNDPAAGRVVIALDEKHAIGIRDLIVLDHATSRMIDQDRRSIRAGPGVPEVMDVVVVGLLNWHLS